MNRDIDVLALGEVLIDLIQYGTSDQGNPLYEANPGGAPANVLAMLGKLGYRTSFIGKVGKDGFGRQLKEALQEQKIDTDHLLEDEHIPTTLALVHKTADGDRDFSFYRKPGADVMLREEEVDERLFPSVRIFHVGSLSMSEEPVRSATKKALSLAEKNGCLISLDPNLREALWDDLKEAHIQIDYLLQRCHILKIADNELVWFTGKEDYEKGIAELRKQYPQIRLIALTMGKEGSRAYYKDIRIEAPAFLSDKTVDTTGAGDTFCGCMLGYVLEHGLEDLKEDDLKEMLRYANAAASIVTTRKGALRSMPEREEIEKILE